MNKTHIIEYLLKELNNHLQTAVDNPETLLSAYLAVGGEAITFAGELLEILANNNKNFFSKNQTRLIQIKKSIDQATEHYSHLEASSPASTIKKEIQGAQKALRTALAENKKLIKTAYRCYHAPVPGQER